MQTCANCGHLNPEDIHLCLSCASPLGRRCPECDTPVSEGFKFCGNCGAQVPAEPQPAKTSLNLGSKNARNDQLLRAFQSRMPTNLSKKILAAPPELVGQRREITVLFVTVDQIFSPNHSYGNEELLLKKDQLLNMVVDIIYRYEGTIDKFTGEGLMALFGLPINHENDPERAVRAAMEILSKIEPYQEKRKLGDGIKINLRIGINTGYIIAGKLGGHLNMDYTVIGNTVTLAAHLEEKAESGSALVSFRTYQRTRPIVKYEPLIPFLMEGTDHLVKAYKPLQIRAKPGMVRGLPGLRTPMVGRQEILDQIVDILNKVVRKQSCQFVLISGEAGLGKTRLLLEFQKLIGTINIRVFQGTCSSYLRIVPYRVVAEIIRGIIQVSDLEEEAIQREILQHHLASLRLDSQEVFPYLLHVLGIPQADPILQTRMRLLDPDMLQRQIHTALRTFFIAESAQSPILFIFEDLHWVDPASQKFIEYFVMAIENNPIMSVLISRKFDKQFFSDTIFNALHEQEQLTDISLQPLDNFNSRILLDRLINTSSPELNELKEEISSRAVGNPYYIEELIRTLIEKGGLYKSGDTWVADATAKEIIHEVPGTLQDIILARFDQQPDDLRKLLQKSSILGGSTVTELLQILVDETPEVLYSYLDLLEKRDFITRSQVDFRDVFYFRHPLIQETIYQTILSRDLRSFHSRIAEAIEQGNYWLPEDKHQFLSHHYTRSDTPHKSIPHLIRAGLQAMRQFANETAVQLYSKATQLMDDSPAWDVNPTQYAEARIGLGTAYKFMGKLDEGAAVLEQATEFLMKDDQYLGKSEEENKFLLLNGLRELADIRSRKGDLEIASNLLKAGLNILGPNGFEHYPVEWRRLSDRIAWVYFRQGKLEEAFGLADLALLDVNIREVEDPITLASINNTLGGIYWQWAKQQEAIQHVELSLKIYQNLNYYWGVAIAYTNLGILYYTQGKWNDAVSQFEKADEIRNEYGYTLERPTNLKNMGELLINLGDFDAAQEKLEKSREISRQLGMTLFASYAEIGLCRLAITQENFELANEYLTSAKEAIVNLETPDDLSVQLMFMDALILSQKKEVENAIRITQEALQVSEQGGFAEEVKEGLRILGTLYSEIDEFDKAEFNIQQALTLAEESDDDFRRGKSLVAMSELYILKAKNDTENAASLLDKALRMAEESVPAFDRLGAKAYLRESQNLRNKIARFRDVPGDSATLIGSDDDLTNMRRKHGIPYGEWHEAVIINMALSHSEAGDDELVFETLALMLPAILEIVTDFGGNFIRKRDSFLFVFGAEGTREDDAERAIETTMDIANHIQELRRQTHLPFTNRFAISKGKVLAGTVSGTNTGRFSVAGEPLQAAEKLVKITSNEKIWVTKEVRNATGHLFEYIPVPSDYDAQLPGTSIYQLEGLRDQIIPVRGIIGIKTPLVGRKHEMEIMSSSLANLKENNGGIIWITGEPGIGKSRLMREFANEIKKPTTAFWQGNCLARRTDRAFSLFSDLLMHVFGLQPNTTNQEKSKIIREKMKDYPEDMKDSIPYFHMLLGILHNDYDYQNLASLEPEQLQRQTFAALRKLLEVTSTKQQLVLLLDDVQWIDPISADLLLFLSNLVRTNPIIFIITQRSSEQSVAEKVLTRIRELHADNTLLLYIQPFSKQECQSFLNTLVSEPKLPDDLMGLIIEQSSGNPYYIEEFVRMLVEKDYLRVEKGRLTLNLPSSLQSLSIPSSLEMLIRSRVDSLPMSAKKLLQVASVIGGQFQKDLLEKVTDLSGISALVSLLENRGMINRTGRSDNWEFSHALIESTVYYSLLKVNRRHLHKEIAQTIETHFQDKETDFVEELAHHYDRAGEKEKALKYLILAGNRFAAQYANEEALVHYTKAADMLKYLPNTSEDYRWRIAVGLGEIYQFIGKFDDSITALQSEINLTKSLALSRAQRAGLFRQIGETMHKKGDQEIAISFLDEGLVILDAPEGKQEKEEAARILARLGWSYFLMGNLSASKEAGEKALQTIEGLDIHNARAMSENLLGGVYYRIGDLNTALLHTTRAKDTWEILGASWQVAQSFSNLGILEASRGNLEYASNNFQRSLIIRQEMGDVEGVAITNNNLGKLSCDRGQLDHAESYFLDSLAVAKPFQIAWQIANSTAGLAQTLLYQGRLDEADEVLEEGFLIVEEISAKETLIEMQIIQSGILMERGKDEEGIEMATKAAQTAAEIGNRWLESWSWRVMANCYYLKNQAEEAKSILQNSWKALEEVSEELEKGRVHALAAEIEIVLGNASLADEHNSSARKIFTDFGAARDLSLLKERVDNLTQKSL